MERKKDYKLEIILSVLCAKWYTSSHYISEYIGLELIFSAFIYPYLIYKLKYILNDEYTYSKVNQTFSIVILALIINSISLFGVSIFNTLNIQLNYQYRYFTFVNITAALKSIAFIILGIALSKKMFQLKTSLKIFAICQIIDGIKDLFFSVIEIFRLTNLYSYSYPTAITKFMNNANLALQILIFASLASIFIKSGILRERFNTST